MEVVKKYKKILVVITILVIGIILGIKLFSGGNSAQPTPASQSDSIISTANLNTDFSFPLKDSKGNEISNVNINASNAELKSEVIIKGSRSAAQNGKAFLIIDLKITNDYNKSIDVNTRNYFRLSLEGKDVWLAADIHNDPVKVQAISTKLTRIGFIVDKDTKKYILRIGEIDGDKQEIEINF